MINKLQQLREEFLQQLHEVKNKENLQAIDLRFLSRRGELGKVMHELKDLSANLRQEAGILANNIKKELQEKFAQVSKGLEGEEIEEVIDPTLPGKPMRCGHLHPLTIVQNEMEDLFASLGFMIIDGPELESDYFNFTALNVAPDHPARDMQDTFYVSAPEASGPYDLVMRTQTSPMQIRAMKKYGAPLKAFIPGRCFRNESTDARHEHTFYQAEGILIDQHINFANLKSFLEIVGKRLFGSNTKLRMRPKFFPFVEPGNNGEYTCFLCEGSGCRVCKYSGWLEIVGAGLIHPEVLRAGGIDSDRYSGLAFGFGLTRLVMLKYHINDVRLFNGGDIRFLEQF